MNNNSRRRPKKFLTLIICLNLVVMLVVGGTIAYIFTTSDPVVNTFTPVTPGTTITEDFKGSVKENVVVKNTGQVDSYIRAKVVITWQDEDGNVYPTEPVEDTTENDGDYTISYLTAKDSDGNVTTTTDWTKGNDGFWYYKESIAPGEFTTNLIGEAKQIKACTNLNYTLHIEILSQAIQSTPAGAVDVWDNPKVNVTGNANGTLSVANIGGQ